MGLMDKFDGLKDKAVDAAADHKEQVANGVDKAADFAKDKTGGKFDGQIDAGAEKVKDFVEKLDDKQ